MEIFGSSSMVNEMDSSKTSYRTDRSHVYGREDEKWIVQLLLSDDCKTRNLTIICIFGACGIGKTTMVQLIYSDRSVEDAFDTGIFIGMHENFDEKRLMKEMIGSLTGAQCDITEPSILEDIVKDELMGKKLLLVLDSAENETKSFWDYLFSFFSVVAKGSVVLVMSNKEGVANVTGPTHRYRLNYLSESDCWLIFQQLAFRGADPNALPELVKIGKQLVTKCACNILCIKMLAGLLSHSISEESWKSVLESDLWDIDKLGREILPALRVSYGFLPLHLKWCFTYCSLFPKGYIFSKRRLVRFWLAQGFISSVERRDLEDTGSQYFEELFSRSFFHQSHLHAAKDDKFVIHELIHDLARYVSRNVCFTSQDCVQIIPKGVHHFSFVPSEYQTVKLNAVIAEVKDLQSFLVVNRFVCQWDSIISPIIHLMGLNDLFVKLSSVRVLDLGHTDIEELPDSIKLLRNLCYLGLNNTKIRSLPQEIGSLINLLALEAKGCYNLVELPKSIQELTNLEHLDVTKEAGFISMPVGIGKLTNLKSLSMFYVGNDETHSGINELKNINGVKGCLQIYGLENVGSEIEAKEASLGDKLYLETLSLQWSSSMVDIEDENGAETSEKILQNLQPSNNLEGLIVRNYPGNVFPLWIGDPSYSKLISIILDNCPNCSTFPALGRLPSLKILSVQKMFSVETEEVPGGSFATHNAYKFPSLELLNIWDMYDLGELFEIGDGDYPRLHTLSISRCPMLSTIPKFPSLLELSIHYCTQLSEIPKLPLLRSLKLDGLQEIISLELQDSLIMLNKLEINRCSELLSLEGLSSLTYIEELRLTECPKVNLPDGWQPHSFRKDVYIRVDGNKEVDTNNQNVSIAKEESASLLKVDRETILEIAHEITNQEEVVKEGILEKGIDDTAEEHRLKLEMTEKVILMWDSSPLFDSPEGSSEYLSAVDDLLSLSLDPSLPSFYRDRADSNLQLAMSRLVDEFRHLAFPPPLDQGSLPSSHHTSSLLHMSLSDLAALAKQILSDMTDLKPSPVSVLDAFQDTEHEAISDTELEAPEPPPLSPPLSLIKLLSPYIIPENAIPHMKEIAVRMIRARRVPDLCKAYGDSRREALSNCLADLGIDKMSTEEVQRLDWPTLESKIQRWIPVMTIVIQFVLLEDVVVCETIYHKYDGIVQMCLVEAAKGCVLQLLEFGNAVAIGKRTPEKLFLIIQMYYTLDRLLRDLASIFYGRSGHFVLEEAEGILSRLGDAFKDTISMFGDYIQKSDNLEEPLECGEIHPLTCNVMDYIILLADYIGELDYVLPICDIGTSTAESECTDLSPSEQYVLTLMSYLEANLDEKKKLYDDKALQHIFMMNNLVYIVTKVMDSELKTLLGDNWISKRQGRLRIHTTGYFRPTWTSILTLLKADESGGIESSHRNHLKEKLKSFNSAFDEIYQVQTGWKVPDEELRKALKNIVSKTVKNDYSAFYLRFKEQLDGSESDNEYIKYTPEDLDNHIADLFEGFQGVPGNPRKRETA